VGDEEKNDTCDHYRVKYKVDDLADFSQVWIKIDLNDEGHPGIYVGCFTGGSEDKKCVGQLNGRFAIFPSKLGCYDLEDNEFRKCVSVVIFLTARG
jgi:hypothetical protein